MSFSMGPDNAIMTYVIGLGIVVPVFGAWTRYKINFTPKRIFLEAEAALDEDRPSVHEVDGIWAMLKRVHKLDGISGLYKGLMPTGITIFVGSAFYQVTSRYDEFYWFPNHAPTEPWYMSHVIVDRVLGSIATFLIQAFQMLMFLPPIHIIFRAIVTEEHLPFFNAFAGLQVLLSARKLHEPWLIFATPGLMRVRFLQLGWYIIVLRTARNLLVAHLDPWSRPIVYLPATAPIPVAIYLLIVTISACIINPLEILASRLTIQHYPIVKGEHAKVHAVAEAMENIEEHVESAGHAIAAHLPGHNDKKALPQDPANLPAGQVAGTSSLNAPPIMTPTVTRVAIQNGDGAGSITNVIVATTPGVPGAVKIPIAANQAHEHHRIIHKIEQAADRAVENLEEAWQHIQHAGLSVERQWDTMVHAAARVMGLEDIIRLPDPYMGVRDGFVRIFREEGFTTFFRAWWITWFILLASTFGP